MHLIRRCRFAPSTSIVLQHFDYMRYMEITIGMAHRTNWQGWGERWDRRTAFYAALLHYTKELGITCNASAQPVQYWQDDLEADAIYEDDEDIDDARSPISPVEGGDLNPPSAHPIPNLMGFVPPEGSKMRRRKGHSRRRNMAGVGA